MMDGATITRCVSQYFVTQGLIPMTEYLLPNGRRLDVAAIGKSGNLCGVEVKASQKDFNRDLKWADAQRYCFIFYIAVPHNFPVNLIHPGVRVMKCNGETAWISRKTGRGLARHGMVTNSTKLYAVNPLEADAPFQPAIAGDASRGRIIIP